MNLRLQHHVLSLALAAVVTLGLLAGVNGLARHEATSGLAGQMAAAAVATPAV